MSLIHCMEIDLYLRSTLNRLWLSKTQFISTYPRLEFVSNFSEGHILLNAVHAILKFDTSYVYIGYHRTNITWKIKHIYLFRFISLFFFIIQNFRSQKQKRKKVFSSFSNQFIKEFSPEQNKKQWNLQWYSDKKSFQQRKFACNKSYGNFWYHHVKLCGLILWKS